MRCRVGSHPPEQYGGFLKEKTMKFYIKTYGCQMNERDSEAAAAMLLEDGHIQVASETEADLILFNTCSVREQAELKAIGKISILKPNWDLLARDKLWKH